MDTNDLKSVFELLTSLLPPKESHQFHRGKDAFVDVVNACTVFAGIRRAAILDSHAYSKRVYRQIQTPTIVGALRESLPGTRFGYEDKGWHEGEPIVYDATRLSAAEIEFLHGEKISSPERDDALGPILGYPVPYPREFARTWAVGIEMEWSYRGASQYPAWLLGYLFVDPCDGDRLLDHALETWVSPMRRTFVGWEAHGYRVDDFFVEVHLWNGGRPGIEQGIFQ